MTGRNSIVIREIVSACKATQKLEDIIVESADVSVSGAISEAAGPRLNMVLKTLGGCEAGEAKTTIGMPFNLISKLLTSLLLHVSR